MKLKSEAESVCSAITAHTQPRPHPDPSAGRSQFPPRLTGALPAARAAVQLANAPTWLPPELTPTARELLELDDRDDEPPPRWQWYPPFFRSLWHPSAFSPPPWAKAITGASTSQAATATNPQ